MKRIFLLFIMIFVCFPALAANKIVATYPPIQSLVWGITEGVTPVNLMFTKGDNGHHDVQLKPSQMKTLRGADIVFYASDDLETFMKDALSATAPNAKAYSLMEEIPELNLLPSLKDPQKKDVHYWMDPDNAILMLDKIADIMIEQDPKNKEKYEANRQKAKSFVEKLKQEKDRPDASKSFLAFHGGFEYMAKSFGLNIQTSKTDIEDISTPQAAYKFKQELKDSKADCFLLEPQITRKQIKDLQLKDKNFLKMDAFGWNVDSGPGQYYRMMRLNLHRLSKCKAKK